MQRLMAVSRMPASNEPMRRPDPGPAVIVCVTGRQALLTPTEVQLAVDINALGGQVLIALEDGPPSSSSSESRQWTAAAVNSLPSPATSTLQSPAFQKMLSFCLHTGLTPRPPGPPSGWWQCSCAVGSKSRLCKDLDPLAGLRASARLASQASSSELNDGHRQLLHKLLWRGKVSSSPAPSHRETSSVLMAQGGRAAHRGRFGFVGRLLSLVICAAVCTAPQLNASHQTRT
jgi:hypothetical protein